MPSCKIKKITSWVLQLIVAGILLQTLYFKFTGAPESKFIFSTLGVEPWGRVATGLAELVAAVLLLVPGTVTLGALLSLFIMIGAIVSHLTKLGIEVQGDGGLLFSLAVAVFAGSAIILLIRRQEIPILGRRFPVPVSGADQSTHCQP